MELRLSRLLESTFIIAEVPQQCQFLFCQSMSSTSPTQRHCQTDGVLFHSLRTHARQGASQSYYLPTLSRRGCPHLVVRFPFQVIRHVTSTFVWLELYHVSRSLRHETAPQSCCHHGVPQRRSPSRGEGSSVSCHVEK